MMLTSVGLDHTRAPVDLRERFAWQGATLDRHLARLACMVSDGFILSTCNRTEVYASSERSVATALVDFLATSGGVSHDTVQESGVVREQADAVAHLFAVSGGIRSMVTGEHQILAQLKGDLARARRKQTLGPITHRLGCAALAVGKRIRTETSIGQRAPSVVAVALHEIEARIETALGDHAVLVIGAGHNADLTLREFRRRAGPDARAPEIVNRTSSRAHTLATVHGATPVSWSALGDAVARARVVICCTSAPHAVVDRALIEQAMTERAGRPLLIVDLALPRDVDSAVRDLDGVTVLDLDHVDAIGRAARGSHALAIQAAEQIVAEHGALFMDWLSVRRIAPTISALVSRAEAIRDAETERVLSRLPGLSPDERAVVRELAARVTGKLLDAPLTVLNVDGSRDELAAALQRLFLLAEPMPSRAFREPRLRHAGRRQTLEPQPGASTAPTLVDT